MTEMTREHTRNAQSQLDALAAIKLAEGRRMSARVDPPNDDLAVGMALTTAFEQLAASRCLSVDLPGSASFRPA